MIFAVIVLFTLLLVAPPVAYLRGVNKGIANSSPSEPLSLESKCFHVWSKWKDDYITYVDADTGQKKYRESVFIRICEECGWQEWKKPLT